MAHKLQDFSTQHYLFNPQAEDFVEELGKLPEFQFETKLSRRKLFTYITLMADPKSEIRTQYQHLGSRKREAAKCAGFEIRQGKFPVEVEKILIGQHEGFNRAFVKYLSMTYNPVFVQIEVYRQLLHVVMQKALTGEAQFINKVADITDKLESLEKAVFMGEEVSLMRKALYKQSELQELDFTPEHIAIKLSEGEDLQEFSKYGEDYEVDKMHFIGDEEPKEDTDTQV